jgi:hypothetical protein
MKKKQQVRGKYFAALQTTAQTSYFMAVFSHSGRAPSPIVTICQLFHVKHQNINNFLTLIAY